MEPEQVKDHLNEAFAPGRFRNGNRYDAVQVLVIYWAEDDRVAEFKKEAEELRELFFTDFGYNVNSYEIPTVNCSTALNLEIANWMVRLAPNTLFIIHYGGHADEDRPQDGKGGEKRSVWTLNKIDQTDNDRSTVKWYQIQSTLESFPSDILLILDCCFGAQAGRADNSERSLPPNAELLAACPMNVNTPLPGRPGSFTLVLMTELRNMLRSPGYVKMSDLYRRLVGRDKKLTQTPVYIPLPAGKGTICLAPFQPINLSIQQRNAALLTIKVSLGESFTPEVMALKDIINWLLGCAPVTVSAVSVERVVYTVSNIKPFMDDAIENQGRNTAGLGNINMLPDPAQSDIWSAWNFVCSRLTRVAMLLRPALNTTAGVLVDKIDEDLVNICAEDLEKGVVPLERTIEHGIMGAPQLEHKDELMAAIENPTLQNMGFADLLNLRYMAKFPKTFTPDDSMDITYSSTTPATARTLSIENVPGIGMAIVESRQYNDEDIKKGQIRVSMQRMEALARLLNARKSSDFLSFTAIRWFQDAKKSRYGLVFAIPKASKEMGLMSLHDIMEKVHESDKPTLWQRFDIAHKIGKALSKWHTIGWLHQGISGRNVWFFYTKTSSSSYFVDYSQPFLCGFDYARTYDGSSESRIVTNFDQNVYRHPNRQGVPDKSHTQIHDLYAYGVLLLEIGVWDLVTNAFSPHKRQITRFQVRDYLLKWSKNRLPHHMGEAYQKATTLCLGEDFGIEDDNRADTLIKAFETWVLDRISLGLSIRTDL